MRYRCEIESGTYIFGIFFQDRSHIPFYLFVPLLLADLSVLFGRTMLDDQIAETHRNSIRVNFTAVELIVNLAVVFPSDPVLE